MKLVIQRRPHVHVWGVTKQDSWREAVFIDKNNFRVGDVLLVQAEQGGLWTVASAISAAMDRSYLDQFDWMPFKIAVVKLRLLL